MDGFLGIFPEHWNFDCVAYQEVGDPNKFHPACGFCKLFSLFGMLHVKLILWHQFALQKSKMRRIIISRFALFAIIILYKENI
jgi:adenylosuccinate lyase